MPGMYELLSIDSGKFAVIFMIYLSKELKRIRRKVMTPQHCNALHVWLLTPLQSVTSLPSLLVRWQSGGSILWW